MPNKKPSLARRLRIQNWSPEKRARKLEQHAREGDGGWVADILAETEYENFDQLLQPKWWGTQDLAQLRTGRKLLEDLFETLPAERHQDLKAGLPKMGIAIVRLLASRTPKPKLTRQ